NADVCVSILGSQIFKKHLIEVLPIFMNLHSSLLPIHRGMLPSFWSMIRKDREVGVSLFQVDEGIDSGPIIMQKRVLNTFKTQAEFIRVTKNMGITAILEILENDEIVLSPQSEYNKGYNNMPERRDVQEFYRLGFKFF
ncbi:formyltransferase family protein, partial [Planktomarina temperata]|nr:formyltransferase family protein [Planktomarina temperata]